MAIILSYPRARWFNFRLLCAHNANGKRKKKLEGK